MISYNKFYKLYNSNSPENKKKGDGSFIFRYLLRDAAHPIAYLFAKMNISANFVSFLMFLLYILSALLFIMPNPYLIVVSIVLFLMADILDCVDGSLARYFMTYSSNGKVLDSFIHTLTASIFAACFGIRVYLITNNVLVLIVAMIGIASFSLDSYWLNMKSSNDESDSKQGRVNYLKNVINIFNDIPTFLLISLIISGLYNITGNINYIYGFFLLYIGIIFLGKIVYRLLVIFSLTSKVHGITWKGWN